MSSCQQEIQFDYEEACNEVVELQAELRAEKIEAQQLLMRFKTARNRGGAHRPGPNGNLSLPAVAHVVEEQRAQELRRLFSWLAQHADLESPQILDVGFEVPIGGRTVHLQRVVQWPLNSAPGGQLLLTAPVEHKDPLGNLLATTKANGQVDSQAILHFLAGWDIVAGELTTAIHFQPEPSVLLSHRASTQGILVATWPTRHALEVFHTICSLPTAPGLGDRVEVDYGGTRYAGTLHSIDANGMASVRCDSDAPGVLTVTPLLRVRRLVGEVAASAAMPAATTFASAAASVPPLVGTSADASRAISAIDRPGLEALRQEVPAAGVRRRVHRRTRSSAF